MAMFILFMAACAWVPRDKKLVERRIIVKVAKPQPKLELAPTSVKKRSYCKQRL